MVECQTDKQLICKEEQMQEGKNVTLEQQSWREERNIGTLERIDHDPSEQQTADRTERAFTPTTAKEIR